MAFPTPDPFQSAAPEDSAERPLGVDPLAEALDALAVAP